MTLDPEPVVPDMPMEDQLSAPEDETNSAENMPEEPELESAPVVMENVGPEENPSGREAAETARSLASIAEDIKSDNAPVAVANSLANIAASIDPPKASAQAEPESAVDEDSELENVTPDIERETEEDRLVASSSGGAGETENLDEAEAFRGALMSPSSDGAVTGSFDRLKRSAMDDLDAKTEAILRPMLREWLDENLPTLVEKLVRREIERVARGQ